MGQYCDDALSMLLLPLVPEGPRAKPPPDKMRIVRVRSPSPVRGQPVRSRRGLRPSLSSSSVRPTGKRTAHERLSTGSGVLGATFGGASVTATTSINNPQERTAFHGTATSGRRPNRQRPRSAASAPARRRRTGSGLLGTTATNRRRRSTMATSRSTPVLGAHGARPSSATSHGARGRQQVSGAGVAPTREANVPAGMARYVQPFGVRDPRMLMQRGLGLAAPVNIAGRSTGDDGGSSAALSASARLGATGESQSYLGSTFGSTGMRTRTSAQGLGSTQRSTVPSRRGGTVTRAWGATAATATTAATAATGAGPASSRASVGSAMPQADGGMPPGWGQHVHSYSALPHVLGLRSTVVAPRARTAANSVAIPATGRERARKRLLAAALRRSSRSTQPLSLGSRSRGSVGPEQV